MPRFLVLILALVVPIIPLAHGQNSCNHKPATRAKAKKNAKNNEAKAAAQLEKAKSLLNAGKREQAIPRLWIIVRRYPRTRSAITSLIMLRFMPP